MADKKISELVSADALSGAELIETVQGGVNKRTTTQAIANLVPPTQSNFLGLYTSLGALESAHPTAISGNWAIVDPGSGTDAVKYLWDEDEGWVSGGSGAGVLGITGDGVDNTDPANPVISYPTPGDISAANAVHTHAISDVTNLQTSLDAKAAELDSTSASTAGGTITLDMDSRRQRMFVGSASFATAKTLALSNATNALVFNFHFEVSNVAATLEFPATWMMADDNFSAGDDTWTPPSVGKYEMGGSFDGTNWKIKIVGPFS